MKPRHVIIALVLVAIIPILYTSMKADVPGKKSTDGSVISKRISQVDGDATASFVIRLQEGGDAVHEADHIFESVQSDAVERASLDTESLKLELRYDSGQTSEAELRKFLLTAGYLAPTAADAVPAELVDGGKRQEISLAAGAGLEPSLVSAKAGVPLTLVFSPGVDHLRAITIPDLGVSQSLVDGARLELKDLKPGTYSIICADGVADGALIVE